MISYEGLEKALKEKGIGKTELSTELGPAPGFNYERETSKPSEVHNHMKALIDKYNAKENVTTPDIIEFHAKFEHIHPFQDGNGRVGRLVALKECLHHNVIPFIIEDGKKGFYYRGLSEWINEKGYLTDTCLDGQDTFVQLLDMLEIPHE